MDCSPPGPSVHGILQARILEWVAIFFSRGYSLPMNWTHISHVSCTGRRILYHWCHLGSHLGPNSGTTAHGWRDPGKVSFFFFFISFYLFNEFIWLYQVLVVAYGIPWPGIEPRHPELDTWSLSHSATREVLGKVSSLLCALVSSSVKRDDHSAIYLIGLLGSLNELFHIKHRMCVHAQLLSCVRLLASPWTVVCQAPLFMGFFRQGYWSG